MIKVDTYDLNIDLYAKIYMDDNAVTTVASASDTPGSKAVNLHRSRFEVDRFALLVKGMDSPSGDAFSVQYWIPEAYVSTGAEVSYVKDVPAALGLQFGAIQHSANGYGTYREQRAAVHSRVRHLTGVEPWQR